MTALAIRQSGGANIISIPKAILKILNLHVGSKLTLSVINSNIILTPVIQDEIQEMTLEGLLSGTPKEAVQITDEDREWLESIPRGKEIE